ncbi:MAG: acyltransferase [Bacteroidales bacterium]|nr:acyltransferase [Bacteroidales bacterium]
MSLWKGKTRGSVLGYKIFVAILKYLGLPFAYFLLRFVVIYYLLFSPKSIRALFFYFRSVLRLSIIGSFVNICRNYYLFGQILLDKVAMMAEFKTNFTFDFDGEEHLRKMVENNTGGILISAHIGNFEIAGHLLNRLNTKINIVMLDAEHKKIKEYLSGYFKRNNVNIIAIKDDFSHIYEINKAIENKEIICMHGDRFVSGSKNLTAVFFEKEAGFPNGPFYLAVRYNVPVSFVFAMKENKNHYHFYASSLKYYGAQNMNRKNRDEHIKTIISEYISELEKIIRKYPTQWFNYYNFWEEEL